jgi:formate dehydrogenase subunit gamma
MSVSAERIDESGRRRVGGYGRTVVREGELLRHPVYTRVLHWSVAIFFLLALLSGIALFNPWLYRMLTPLFGGGATTRLLHPWFSLGFVVVFAMQFVNWLHPMTWNRNDRRWLGRLREYVSNSEEREPEHVGFFNAGQKLYFWSIVVSTIVFFVTGIFMWFPQTFGRLAVAVGYVLHDLAALLMLGGLIVHLYEATIAQPGTFRSMIRGTVDRRWAWTHHPAWYRDATGRDARADYEHARKQQPPGSAL